MPAENTQTAAPSVDRGAAAAVVLAVDGSSRVPGARDAALREADARSAPLLLVHVVPSYVPVTPMAPLVVEDFHEAGRRLLAHEAAVTAERGKALGLRVRLDTHLVAGSRARGISDAAARAQLVVVGRHDADHVLTRSRVGTAAKVASRVTCPVLVVPEPGSDRAPAARESWVVVGVRGDEREGGHGRSTYDAVDAVVEDVFAWAARLGAGVHALHAWSLPQPYGDIIEGRTHRRDREAYGLVAIDAVLGSAVASHPEVPVRRTVVHRDPASALVDAGDVDLGVELLVLLRPHHPLLPAGHLGRTARGVMATSTVPVCVVPACGGPRVGH